MFLLCCQTLYDNYPFLRIPTCAAHKKGQVQTKTVVTAIKLIFLQFHNLHLNEVKI